MLMAAEIDGRGPQIKIGRVTPLFRLPETRGTPCAREVMPPFLALASSIAVIQNWKPEIRSSTDDGW
jgi:hypothetical protein